MKFIISALLVLTSTTAFAGLDCKNMAIKAASAVYQNREYPKRITKRLVRANPNNTSNGVSLIVTINDEEYLVFLSAASADGNATSGCTQVHYSVAYPYAEWMPQ